MQHELWIELLYVAYFRKAISTGDMYIVHAYSLMTVYEVLIVGVNTEERATSLKYNV